MKLPAFNSVAGRRFLLVGLAAAVLAAAIFIALRLLDNPGLPRLPLITLAGRSTDLVELTGGKPTVVNLWATWCPPCRRELPLLARAQREEAQVNFVFVDQGEAAATVEQYLGAVRLELANVLLDPGNSLGREIGSSGLPITLFYDAGGRMVDSHLGAISPQALAAKLDRVRSAAAPNTRPRQAAGGSGSPDLTDRQRD